MPPSSLVSHIYHKLGCVLCPWSIIMQPISGFFSLIMLFSFPLRVSEDCTGPFCGACGCSFTAFSQGWDPEWPGPPVCCFSRNFPCLQCSLDSFAGRTRAASPPVWWGWINIAITVHRKGQPRSCWKQPQQHCLSPALAAKQTKKKALLLLLLLLPLLLYKVFIRYFTHIHAHRE